jgi:hypothetical protein
MNSGGTTCNSSRSRKPFARFRATWDGAPFSIRSRTGSKPICSSRSSRMASGSPGENRCAASPADGLMPRPVFEKLATVQRLDARIPPTDGRELLLTRHTEPSRDVNLLLHALKLELPPQPSPRISRKQPGLGHLV